MVGAVWIAIIIGKHLYGGLGQNPFNPAMVAFCAMIVAFPALMSQWPGAGQLDFSQSLALILGGERAVDAITSATPLDALRTGLRQGHELAALSSLQGSAFAWVAAGYALGGLWLIQQRVISVHLPLAFLAVLALISGVAHLINPALYAPPLFHLLSGGAMLGAFFIITDPVSSASTPRGKLIFAAGAALITWLIRTFGAYPDGVAFATLLMNILVPLIDMETQPPVFGRKGDGADHE
jgi:electron transport complex protein RnfD